MQAAEWLMNNGSLYREEGIAFNLNWIYQYNTEISEDIHGDYEISDKQPITSNDSEGENFLVTRKHMSFEGPIFNIQVNVDHLLNS